MLTQKIDVVLTRSFQGVLISSILAWTVNIPGALNIPIFGEQFLAIALGCCVTMVFLQPERNVFLKALNYTAALAAIVTFVYVAVRYKYLINDLAYLPLDGIIVSALIIGLGLEATRRVVGNFICFVAIFFMIYALFGHNLPDDFASRPLLLTRLIVYLGMDSNAIFGRALDIGVFVIVPFLLMGKFLTVCGGSAFFSDLSAALMGNSRGGAAKISLIGSVFFGSISGSAVANVAGTGIITVPMMKKSGFPPKIAAAIEAVASTGGQLMPPVMGASAFLMAEFLEIAYAKVMFAALAPAALYYIALFIYVDLKARELGLSAIPADQIPDAKEVMARGWFIPLPFVIFLGSIFAFNFQPQNAALLATSLLVIIGFTTSYGGDRITLKQFFTAILDTGSAAIEIIVICAVAGLVIGSLNLSGLAFNLSQQLVSLSGDSLLGLLLMAAIVSIVLGMGMPTVGVYVLLSSLIAPALIEAGVDPLGSHMFVLYFGMLSMITPPVALASVVSAKLAGADPWQTSWSSMHVGWVAYVVPFLFVGYPALLMLGTPSEFLWAIFISVSIIFTGSIAVSGFFMRKLNAPIRLILMASICLILTGIFFPGSSNFIEVLGLFLMSTILAQLYFGARKKSA